MKKALAISFFLFQFLLSAFSQDTLVYRNGGKITVKILDTVNSRIIFNGPLPADTDVYVYSSNIAYIHYSNGKIVRFNPVKLPKIHSGNTLSITFGQGRPLGSFSSSDANIRSNPNQSRGYSHGNSFADPGGLFNAELNLPIYKSCIGITFSLGYNGNGFDGNNFANFYIPEQNTASSSAQVSASASSYAIATLLTGITFTEKIRKFEINVKVLAGPLFCRTPGIQYGQITPYNIPFPTASVITDSIQSTSNFSLAIGAGVGISYRFSRAVCITAGCNYMYSQTTIQETTKTYYNGGGQLSVTSLIASTPSHITIPVSLLNITLGLKFLL